MPEALNRSSSRLSPPMGEERSRLWIERMRVRPSPRVPLTSWPIKTSRNWALPRFFSSFHRRITGGHDKSPKCLIVESWDWFWFTCTLFSLWIIFDLSLPHNEYCVSIFLNASRDILFLIFITDIIVLLGDGFRIWIVNSDFSLSIWMEWM